MIIALVSVTSSLLSAFLACVALNVSQSYRFYFLLPILLSTFLGFITISQLDAIAPGLGQLWGHINLVHIIHNTAVLYAEKWILRLNGVHQHWNLRAAYKICLNPQLLNTPWEVPHSRKVKMNPSCAVFIRKRLCQLLVFYLVNKYVVLSVFSRAFAPLSIEDFSPTQRVYFRRLFFGSSQVTASETMLRAFFAVHWIWINFIALHFTQTAVAILFSFILCWDEPWEWPPLFGSPLEAYSLRRFWSHFWHRIVYRPYTTYGLWVSRTLFRFPCGSVAEKVSVSIFVFLLSGVTHALVTWQSTGCGHWGDIQWFMLNGIATMGETMVVKWWVRSFSNRNNKKMYETWVKKERLYQLVGYAWVFIFLFWSVPKWEYGKIYCALSKAV